MRRSGAGSSESSILPHLLIVLATPKGHPAASTIHKISSLGAGFARPGYPLGVPHAGKRYLPLSASPTVKLIAAKRNLVLENQAIAWAASTLLHRTSSFILFTNAVENKQRSWIVISSIGDHKITVMNFSSGSAPGGPRRTAEAPAMVTKATFVA